jgi:archaellum component FlaG (FlaF/FlaG flagellin family)
MGIAGTATAATSEGGVAWTVQTADNANGTARGNFSYDAEPGAVIEDAMIVMNTGTVALPLSVYAADAFTASSGEIDVLVDGTPSVDSGTWVSVNASALELAPGEQTEVTFRISVPADARPGDHAAGIVTSLVSQDASQSLSVDRRLGTRINIRVAGDLAPAAVISAVTAGYTPSWNPFAPGTLTVAYALENSGNTRLTGVETVAFSGPVGLFATTAAPTQLSEIIPGSTIEVRSDVSAMSVGWLSGSVVVSPEGVGLGAGSVAPVTVEYSAIAIPWSLYALLLLVAGIVVTVVLLIRRRERRSIQLRDAAEAGR